MATSSRLSLRLVSLATCVSVAVTAAALPAAAAPEPPRPQAVQSVTTTAPPVLALEPPATGEGSGSSAAGAGEPGLVPGVRTGSGDRAQIAPWVIAAATWCASGMVSGVPTWALYDFLQGRSSGWDSHIRNAVASCLVGPLGSWAWRFMAPWVKTRIMHVVVSQIIRWTRW